MAPSRTKAASHDPATIAKAARMEQRLRDHYAMGQKAKKAKISTKDFAAKHGYNEHTMRKIRAFANGYTAEDLEELCALRRPNGLPLQWGHIPYLLTVKNGKERLKLQQQAIREGWTAPRLNAAIPKKNPSAPSHGRRTHRPATAAEGLTQHKADSELWLRRCNVVMEVVGAAGAKIRVAGMKDAIAGLAVALGQVEQRARAVRRKLEVAGLGKRGT